MDEVYFSLPYVDPFTGQGVITPHYDARTGQSFYPWETNIVPVEDTPAPSTIPEATTNQAPSYETPYWIDTVNRAIERAAQVATLEVAGYPPYPNYPLPTSQPSPQPYPLPGGGITPQPPKQNTVNIPTNILIWGAVFAAFFFLGKGRR